MGVKEKQQVWCKSFLIRKQHREFHQPMIKKFKKPKVPARFKDNIWDIWAAYLAEMESLFCFNCGVGHLLGIIYVCTKYAWIKPLMNKKAKALPHGFIEVVNESKP